MNDLSGRYAVNESGCWIWLGWKHKQGYGLLVINGKRKLAHRVSFELVNGDIPEGAHICHRCDVTSCINPDHLYAGDAKSNRSDAVSRGRAKIPVNRHNGLGVVRVI